MLNKILLIIWYVLRPKYYEHFFSLIIPKLLVNYDTVENKKKAYDCVRLSKAKKVIETVVAYGCSSLVILKALIKNNNGKLFSVDMSHPRKKILSKFAVVEHEGKFIGLIRKT